MSDGTRRSLSASAVAFESGAEGAGLEDVKLRNELKDKLKSAGVSSIEIERPGNKLRVIIKTARPGIIIGRKGAEIDKLKGDISSRTGREVLVSIQEIHKPELNAQLQRMTGGLAPGTWSCSSSCSS